MLRGAASVFYFIEDFIGAVAELLELHSLELAELFDLFGGFLRNRPFVFERCEDADHFIPFQYFFVFDPRDFLLVHVLLLHRLADA